jgi:hypothetical protein
MRLICYPTSEEAPEIVPAPLERDWMDRAAAAAAVRFGVGLARSRLIALVPRDAIGALTRGRHDQ